MCGQQPEGDAKAPTMKILVTRLATREMNFLTVSYLFVRFSYPLQFAVIPGPSGCSCGTGSFAFWIETWVADDDLDERQGYKKSEGMSGRRESLGGRERVSVVQVKMQWEVMKEEKTAGRKSSQNESATPPHGSPRSVTALLCQHWAGGTATAHSDLRRFHATTSVSPYFRLNASEGIGEKHHKKLISDFF